MLLDVDGAECALEPATIKKLVKAISVSVGKVVVSRQNCKYIQIFETSETTKLHFYTASDFGSHRTDKVRTLLTLSFVSTVYTGIVMCDFCKFR